jgi:drug/metabolite transporter (DMT)-like permease
MLTGLFVAARIIANPVSNVFQKQLARRTAEPVFIIAATHALLTLPCAAVLLISPHLDAAPGFWGNIITAAALAVAGNVLLVQALEAGDLSVLGPINAYKALVSVALAVFLVGEMPSVAGMTGMLMIVGGSYFVLDVRRPGPGAARTRLPGVRLRFAALAFSATEAVFLKRALLLSSPLTTFLLWSILGLPIAATAAAILLRTRLVEELVLTRQRWRTYCWLAITTGIMQLKTLLAFGRLEVGYSLALFQLSAIISVLLGYRYFQERDVARRLLGAGVMIGGAALIALKG